MKPKIYASLIALFIGVSLHAQSRGTCGPNLTWTLQNGVLIISGSGNMNDYSYGNAPWYSYRQSITSVVIGDSVTSIGSEAFHQCSGLTSITIPNSVTSIGDRAFSYCSGLTSVTIGNSVTSIGDWAFYGCSGLTSITIPNSVTSIGGEAFRSCSGLTSITIPNSVTSIGYGAFSDCSGLTSVTIPNSVTSIGNSAFSGCSGLTTIEFNAVNCTYAGSSSSKVFDGCTNITSISFGSGVQNIPSYLCYGLSKLTSITIPNNVTSIGNYAFSDCSNLTSVTIPNSVTIIKDGTFYGCSGLTSITIPNSVTFIRKSAFYGCYNLASITIPNSVTSIGGEAFRSCSGLTSITIPNSVTSIGYGAFSDCSGLTSVTIPNSVTSIGNSPFSGCYALDTVYCEGSTPPQLGGGAFYNVSSSFIIYVPCGAVETYKNADLWSEYASKIQVRPSIIQGMPLIYGTGQVSVPLTSCGDTIEAIPVFGYHFVQWTDGNTDNPRVIDPLIEATYIAEFALNTSGTCGPNLTWTLQDSVLTISGSGNMNDYSWDNVPWYSYRQSITSVDIGNSVTSIGDYAFNGCSGLTSVTIGNSVTSIGRSAFSGCSSLTSVTIPNSVTSIGSSAFYECSGLTSVTIGNSVTSIGWYAFEKCSGLRSVTIPNSVTSIGNGAFASCSGLTSVTIPNSVTSIGNDAFSSCQRLIRIEAPAEFFDLEEDKWSRYTKSLQNVTVIAGELNENERLFIARFYKTLKTIDVSAVSNIYLADEAFNGFYNLDTLILPSSLERTGYMMAAGCKNLKCITIPASVTEIEPSAFENCRSMTEVTFAGNNVTRIDDWAFYNCHQLQNLVIPEGVSEIGLAVFYGCTYLNEVSLPASVQQIGDHAFANCTHMGKMRVDAVTPPTIDSKTFDEVSRTMPVYVPDGSVNSYQADVLWGQLNIVGASQEGTSLNNINGSNVSVRKILDNGQLYILLPDGTRYDATGKKVE